MFSPRGDRVVALGELSRWLGNGTRSPPKMLIAVGTATHVQPEDLRRQAGDAALTSAADFLRTHLAADPRA